jgi:hypothetical protein
MANTSGFAPFVESLLSVADRMDLELIADLIDERRAELEEGGFSTTAYDVADLIELADKVRAALD